MESSSEHRNNRWNVGMPFPDGVRKSTEPTCPPIGAGQLANPAAKWVCRPPGNLAAKEAVEEMVQRIAVQVGATHIRIRSKVHNYGFAYDEYGNRMPVFDQCGNLIEWKLIRKDAHVTVDFGHSEDHVGVHGHIYVTADSQGAPTGLMEKGTRKYICDGDDRILELWEQIETRPQHLVRDANNDRPRWQEEFLQSDTKIKRNENKMKLGSAHHGTSPRTGLPDGGDRDFQNFAIMEGASPGATVSRVGAYASRGRHGHGQRHGGCCQEHPGSAGQEQQDEDIPAGLLE
ncbi:hypothetical protein PG990_007701 [Apiospora arundinis]